MNLVTVAAVVAFAAVAAAAVADRHRVETSARDRRGRFADNFFRLFLARRAEYTSLGWRGMLSARVLAAIALSLIIFLIARSD
jgi:hypothetical protein